MKQVAINDSNFNLEEELQKLKERGEKLDMDCAEVLDLIRTLDSMKLTLPSKYRHIELIKEFCDEEIP